MLALIRSISFVPICVIFFVLISTKALHAQVATDTRCVNCHEEQVALWQQSDHAKAMMLPTKENVLGNFNNASLNHYGQQVKFYQKGGEYWIAIGQPDELDHFKVAYTFGHYPLQQYLVATENGKLQVIPYAWDSQDKAEGGQRWYSMYPDEQITPDDRLHWQQPLQNWNGMCADCHSSGLTRNYNTTTDTFNTDYTEINVGCQSCHGDMSMHADNPSLPTLHTPLPKGIWKRDAQETVASWQGEVRDPERMDTCYACHSLRSPLTDGINPNQPFFDQFTPSLLNTNLYHADGQIKEEVYVYGSFQQSKMYQAGVGCHDCHDPHSMKLKVPGNGTCLQCHSATEYNQTQHHGHTLDSAGGQCVNCHMPQTTYMGVDARRDHSFTIPRPNLSKKFGAPNACVSCHKGQSNDWAASAIKQWHEDPKTLSKTHFDYVAMQAGEMPSLVDHLSIINDETLSAIVRATAINRLPENTPSMSDKLVSKWVNASEPLIRLAVAQKGDLLGPEVRQQHYANLLNDPYKAVRSAAAQYLIGIPDIDAKALRTALDELILANEVSTWRGEGNLNQSQLYTKLGKTNEATKALQHGIDVDPYFAENYINLADIYRIQNKVNEEADIYTKALKHIPQNAVIRYSYGLFLIRQQRYTDALPSFEQALKLEPNNVQYIYVYALALDGVNQTQKAIRHLLLALKQNKQDEAGIRTLAELGAQLSRKVQDRASFDAFVGYLQ